MAKKKAKKEEVVFTMPRQYSLVKFDYKTMPVGFHSKYPFTEQGVYVFLGEIPNMEGHCIVADKKSGTLFCGYHTENFIEIPEDET